MKSMVIWTLEGLQLRYCSIFGKLGETISVCNQVARNLC